MRILVVPDCYAESLQNNIEKRLNLVKSNEEVVKITYIHHVFNNSVRITAIIEIEEKLNI